MLMRTPGRGIPLAFAATIATAAAGIAVVSPAAQAATGCQADYAVTSQWAGGFVASVSVTNLGSPLTSWTVTWAYPSGQVITSGWNATVTQSGSQVQASSVAWNGAVATGGSLSFGVQGTSTGTNTTPAPFALNGVTCTGGTTTTGPATSTTSRTTSTTTVPTTSRTTTTTPRTTSTTTSRTTTTTTSSGSTSHWEDVIDGTSFASYSALESSWDYLYPWGSDHNGSARMYASTTDHSQVYLESGGVLVEKATPVAATEGTSTATPHLTIKYHSGAIHAKTQVVVNDQFPNWEVRGEFQVPTAKGTWPAFWLTGVNSWPPESDILEFKGDSRNWFNTFRSSSDVSSTTVTVSSPGSWHTYRAWITKVSATDVDIHYYVDGTWYAVHHATGFVGKPMWIIINLQMEGSSGSPGPTSTTYYRARNLYVGRTRAY